MAPPKDIARSYPKRGLTGDVGFRSEPKFCGDGSFEAPGYPTAGPMLNYAMNHTFSAFTCASWVYIDGDSIYNIYMAAGENAVGGHVAFGWINGTTNPQLRLYDRKGGPSYIPTQLFPEVRKQWCHVAFTLNSAGDTIKMYVNGVLVTGLTQPTAGNEIEMPASNGLTNAAFNVGSFQHSTTGSALALGGNLANFGLYDAELTQDQIRQLMRASDYESCAAVATPQVFFELFGSWAESTGNASNFQEVQTPTFTQKRPQLPRGLDLARGAAQARVYTGRCVDFDGSTDFLDMGTGLDKNYTTRSDRASFSCWFNTDQISAAAWIYQNRTQLGGTSRSECETQLFTHPSLGLVFDGDFASILIPTTDFNIGQWHHFVGIADDSDGPVKAYLDGVLYDTTSIPQSGANGSEFLIGGRNNSPLQIFNGQISNFKIFNVELTQAQVRELYHNPETVIPTGVSASNLRRHYPLCAYNDTGGMGGRYEIDQGVEGVNGEYGGSPVMAFAQPVPCPQLGLQQSATRLYFPGATTQTSATIPALGATASISAWFFWDDAARVSYVTSVGDAGSNTNGLNIRINTSGDVTTNLNGEFDSGLNVTEGTWNHIVVTTQSSSPYWKCFVNNVEASSPAALTGAINITATNAEIGTNNFSFGAAGIVADAAIWTSELSDSNVAALYNSGVMGADVSQVDSSNLVAWWKCDDLTSCKDFSGNGRSMTITTALNAASFPENASGSTIVGDFSMKRKGVSVLNFFSDPSTIDSRAVIPAQASLFPAYPGGYTFSAFFKLIKRGAFSTIFYSTDTSVANQLGVFGSSSGIFQIDAGDGGTSSTRVRVPAVTAITDSDWHHFAVTITHGTPTTTKIYIDGALDVTNTSFTQTGAPTPSDILIGDYPTGTNEARGPIACFRTYQVPLSDNEIEQIYRSDLRLIKGLANE